MVSTGIDFLVKDDRRYDEKYARNARLILRRFVEEAGSQIAAARALGVQQSTVQRAIQPHGQPSIRLLIALREKVGLTIDEMLGAPPLGLTGPYDITQYRDRLRAILAVVEREAASAEPRGRGGSGTG